jgi:pyrroloquinoline quinone biosynthesis protein D
MKPRLARRARLRFDAVRGRWMLLWPERGLLLNESAHAVLRLCDGTRTVEEIVNALAREDERDRVDADVRVLLRRIEARGLFA